MILFTADWHLKLNQKNVPIAWALNRYNLFFEEIYKLEKGCTLHIIGGDLFDRVPTLPELELYFKFIKGVSVDTIIYDGNHEATKKNHTFFTQLAEVSSAINPRVRIVTETDFIVSEHGYGFSVLPYCDLHKKGSILRLNTEAPVFTHVRGEIPPHVKPEVDLSLFDRFPIVFAGDLHSHENTQRNIVYPGSPLTTSFHRNKVKTGYLLIEPETWEWQWKQFKLPQLLRKTVESPDEMVETDYDHTIYELTGDLQSLSKVNNIDLLDKKIVKRSTEASLILEDMTIEQELGEYLSYILELPDDKTEGVMKTFHDYS